MSKYKVRNGTQEVHSARSKLDGVLQTLVTKKGDSPPEKQPDSEDAEESLTLTPTKRSAGGKQSRKRKRGKEEIALTPEVGQYHHTYVMKLFDRSVDLAQFDESTPLYPICRAWMRNQPHNRNLGPRERSPTPEPEPSTVYEEDEDIYSLPSPVPIKVEAGYNVDLRIPTPEPQPNEHLDIHADPDSAPVPEQILLNHMVRWKNIRQRWRNAGRRNECRYASSMELLRNMYDKQCKEN